MPKRRCAAPRCPTLVDVGQRYCPAHARAYNARRGSTTERGYGAEHQALRARWAAIIRSGQLVICPRCKRAIKPGQQWDLGHPSGRDGPTMPEHAACNRREGGQRGNQARRVNETAG